jgi:hypothetical protein
VIHFIVPFSMPKNAISVAASPLFLCMSEEKNVSPWQNAAQFG